MARQMTHELFGSREVAEEQVERYERLGWTAGAEVVPEPVATSRDQILADVGDDPDRAREALAAEQSRPHPRSTLVAALVRVIESADTTPKE